MLNNEIIIRRLATIKYLYTMGVQQSKQADTVAGFSILSFHDCIEMFLLLVAEHNNTKTEKFAFMDFWTKFPNLTLRESMRALKDRRVHIKHKGLFPSKSDIEISRIGTTDFLEQNTHIQFNLDFKHISFFDLINNVEVRRYLQLAEEKANNESFDDSLMYASFAFKELIYTYESSKRYWYQRTFDMGEKIGKEYESLIGGRSRGREERWFKDITNTVNQLQEVLKLTGFGIDYKKYSVFKLLTPYVYRDMSGNYHSHRKASEEGVKTNRDNCKFCIDFVLDCVIKLQEFDFDLKEFIDEERLNPQIITLCPQNQTTTSSSMS